MQHEAKRQKALVKAAEWVHAREACAHSGNAGQGLLPSRPHGHTLYVAEFL